MRYRLGDDTWEIDQDGKELAITAGGKESIRRFVSAEHAAKQLDRLVAEKLAAGYEQVPDPPVLPVEPPTTAQLHELRDAGLEDAILDDPYDAAPYGVYGDWLQRHDDPRGELIALMLGLERRLPEEQKTRARSQVRRHLLAHVARFYGPLAEHVEAPHDFEQQIFTWRFGFIHRIATRRPRAALAALAHPSGRFVAELALLGVTPEVLEALVASPPRALRSLDLRLHRRAYYDHDINDDPIGEPTLDVAPLIAALPALRRLGITAPRFEVGTRLASPVLDRAELRAWEMSGSCAHAVATAQWPALERLDLQLGNGTATFTDLAPLFARTDLTKLTHLKIRGCRFGGEVVAALVTAPFREQLVVLDLSNSRIGDWDAHHLARHPFPALRELWVKKTNLRPPGVQALEGFARHVLFDEARADDRIFVADEPMPTCDPARYETPEGDPPEVDDDDPDRYDEVDE